MFVVDMLMLWRCFKILRSNNFHHYWTPPSRCRTSKRRFQRALCLEEVLPCCLYIPLTLFLVPLLTLCSSHVLFLNTSNF
jgi:hypothetical protein